MGGDGIMDLDEDVRHHMGLDRQDDRIALPGQGGGVLQVHRSGPLRQAPGRVVSAGDRQVLRPDPGCDRPPDDRIRHAARADEAVGPHPPSLVR